MANQEDVRQIALSLPATSEQKGRFAFDVENKGKLKSFVWVWLERIHPKQGRVPNPAVLAVRVRDQAEKAMLLAADPDIFFTEPHYNGFPAVLVRLRAVTKGQLRKLIADAWRCQAPKALQEKDAAGPLRKPSTRVRRTGPSR
jgi:hypothetical protein